MELTLYQRNKFAHYIIPLVKKERCEICSSAQGLEVHHDKLFIETLSETLDELNLPYKDTNEYSYYELELITNIMIGKQIRQNYYTLCKKCHFQYHELEKTKSVGSIIRNNLKEDARKHYEETVIKPYLDSCIGKELAKEDQIKLVELLDIRDARQRKQNRLNVVNKYLNDRFNVGVFNKQVRRNSIKQTIWILSNLN